MDLRDPRRDKKPVLRPPMSSGELVLEIIGLVSVVSMAVILLRSWRSLPDVVPRHFGPTGQPDAWGSRNWLLVGPAVTYFLYALLSLAGRYPYLLNFPCRITPQNAQAQYQLVRMLIRVLKAEIAVFFTYVEWSMLQVAHGQSEGLGGPYLVVFVGVLLGSLAAYMYAATRGR